MKELIAGLGKWPLLLSAIVCLVIASVIASTGDQDAAVALVALVLGSVSLGAWLRDLAHKDDED